MIFAVVARRSALGGPQGPQGRHPAAAVDGAEAPRVKLSSEKYDPHESRKSLFLDHLGEGLPRWLPAVRASGCVTTERSREQPRVEPGRLRDSHGPAEHLVAHLIAHRRDLTFIRSADHCTVGPARLSLSPEASSLSIAERRRCKLRDGTPCYLCITRSFVTRNRCPHSLARCAWHPICLVSARAHRFGHERGREESRGEGGSMRHSMRRAMIENEDERSPVASLRSRMLQSHRHNSASSYLHVDSLPFRGFISNARWTACSTRNVGQ